MRVILKVGTSALLLPKDVIVDDFAKTVHSSIPVTRYGHKYEGSVSPPDIEVIIIPDSAVKLTTQEEEGE